MTEESFTKDFWKKEAIRLKTELKKIKESQMWKNWHIAKEKEA